MRYGLTDWSAITELDIAGSGMKNNKRGRQFGDFHL
jgi:hypothetical protein